MDLSNKSTVDSKKSSSVTRKYVKYSLLTILVLVVIFLVIFLYRYFVFRVSTDDAQISGHIVPVVTRVNAYVSDVKVQENKLIEKDSFLVFLDSSEFKNQLEQIENSLKEMNVALLLAKIQLENAQLEESIALETLKTAEASKQKTDNDYLRNKALFKKKIITKSNFNTIVLAYKEGLNSFRKAKYTLRQAELNKKTAQLDYEKIMLNKEQVALEVEEAKLNLSYTKVKAPIDGIAAKSNIKNGQFVQAGQILMYLVDTSDLWVSADFKETQIKDIRVNKKVFIQIDAFPNIKFKGYVESISPATVSKFALIPPSNASGNFVKIVQRLSVRIRFQDGQNLPPIRPGMSAQIVFYKN
ncbi:MAG: HlyD family secretion protein [Bacteroidales bacterium]